MLPSMTVNTTEVESMTEDCVYDLLLSFHADIDCVFVLAVVVDEDIRFFCREEHYD